MEQQENNTGLYILMCALLGLFWLTVLCADNLPWP